MRARATRRARRRPPATRRRQRSWRPRACGTGTSPRWTDGTFTVTSDGLAEPLKVPALAPRRAARAARAARHSPRAARRRGLDAWRTPPRSPSSAPSCAAATATTSAGTGRSTASRCGAPAAPTLPPARSGMARVTPTAVRLLRSDPFARARAGPRELRRDHPDRHAGRDPHRAGRGRPARRGSAPTRRRTRSRSAWTPAAASTSARSPTCSAPTQARLAAQLGELVYEDPPSSGWCPRPSTCPGTSAPSSSTPAQAAIERPGARGERARAGAGAAGGSDGGGDRAAARRGVDRRRHPPPVPRRDPRGPRHPGGASGRGDVGGQGPQLERASHERVGNRADARPRARQGACSSSAPIQVTDEIDDGRRVVNPTETAAAQEKAQALQERFARVVLGGPRPRPPARRRVQPPVQRDRAARLQHRGRAAHPARPRAHVHTHGRISAPRSRGCSPSPPSGCSTRSAPARRPRW